MIDKKNSILEELNNELNDVLKSLINVDKDSIEYKVLSNKKDNLDFEIEELKKINSNNVITFLDNYREIKNDYPNLTNLNEDSITLLKNIYDEYYKGLGEYRKTLITKSFLSNNYLLDKDINEIDFSKIENSREYDNIINKIDDDYHSYLKIKDYFLKSIKNFNKYKYSRLLDQINDGSILNKDVLNGFRNMGTDSLIDKICNLIDERNGKFFSKSIDRCDYEIKKYLERLVVLIEDYVKRAYLLNDFKLNLKLENTNDFLTFYDKLIEALDEKESAYKITRRDIKLLKSLLEFNEKRFIMSLSKVGINNDLSEKEKEDIFNISIDEINRMMVRVRLLNRFERINEVKLNK